jgi:hypothetical protein
MRTGENAVLRWDNEPDVASVEPDGREATAAREADEDRRSSFWERAAVMFTVFLCFQFALLALFGL